MTQDKAEEREFFDRFADAGSGYEALSEDSYALLLRRMAELVRPRPGELLVDMGCASGAFAARIARAFPEVRVAGIDLSPGCIERGKRDHPRIDFAVGDIEATGRPDGSVDVLCYYGVLHHFGDLSRVTREAFRLLRPGGRFFSYDPHYYSPPLWLYRSPRSPFRSGVGVTSNEVYLRPRDVERAFAAAGFHASAEVLAGVVSVWTESERVRRFVLPVNNLLERVLARTPLGRVLGAAVIGYGEKR